MFAGTTKPLAFEMYADCGKSDKFCPVRRPYVTGVHSDALLDFAFAGILKITDYVCVPIQSRCTSSIAYCVNQAPLLHYHTFNSGNRVFRMKVDGPRNTIIIKVTLPDHPMQRQAVAVYNTDNRFIGITSYYCAANNRMADLSGAVFDEDKRICKSIDFSAYCDTVTINQTDIYALVYPTVSVYSFIHDMPFNVSSNIVDFRLTVNSTHDCRYTSGRPEYVERKTNFVKICSRSMSVKSNSFIDQLLERIASIWLGWYLWIWSRSQQILYEILMRLANASKNSVAKFLDLAYARLLQWLLLFLDYYWALTSFPANVISPILFLYVQNKFHSKVISALLTFLSVVLINTIIKLFH